MRKQYLFAAYRLFFGLLVLFAVGAQLWYGLSRPTFDIINFFSFFTIQSNLVAAGLFIAAAFLTFSKQAGNTLAVVRGAATLYMLTTGIVYVLLLSGLEESLQTPVPWVNFVLHYAMPLAVVADWIMDLPKRRIPFGQAAIWLAYPVGYVAYTLIRGSFVSWYPYPFLNPAENGYAAVILTSVIIGLGVAALAWCIAWTTRSKDKSKKRRTANGGPTLATRK